MININELINSKEKIKNTYEKNNIKSEIPLNRYNSYLINKIIEYSKKNTRIIYIGYFININSPVTIGILSISKDNNKYELNELWI